MRQKQKCPHCDKVNTVEKKSPGEKFKEDIPKDLVVTGLITVASALTSGLVGLIFGGITYAQAVKEYADGIEITCGSCGKNFRVSNE